MKRTLIILAAGLLLSVAAYSSFYFMGSAADRGLAHSATPELAWLKKEFHLNDAEFQRVSELHAGYQAHCDEMCARIAAKNAELRALLETNTVVTPEIKTKLAEAAQIRADCQAAMLAHFCEVSRTMQPNEGRRYLVWVEEKTLNTMQTVPEPAQRSSHDHGMH